MNGETKLCEPVFLEQLMTRAEVGQLLKLSNRTIHRLLANGGLPAPIVIGQSYRWRAKDVEEFIQGCADKKAVEISF